MKGRGIHRPRPPAARTSHAPERLWPVSCTVDESEGLWREGAHVCLQTSKVPHRFSSYRLKGKRSCFPLLSPLRFLRRKKTIEHGVRICSPRREESSVGSGVQKVVPIGAVQDFFHCSPCRMHPPTWAQQARSPYVEKSTWLLWAVVFHLSETTSLSKAGYKLRILAWKTPKVWKSGEPGTLRPHLPHIHTAFCIRLGALGKNWGLAERKCKFSCLFKEGVKKKKKERNQTDWAGFC